MKNIFNSLFFWKKADDKPVIHEKPVLSALVEELNEINFEKNALTNEGLTIIYCMGAMFGAAIGKEKLVEYFSFAEKYRQEHVHFYYTVISVDSTLCSKYRMPNFPRLLFFSKGVMEYSAPEPDFNKPLTQFISLKDYI